LTTHTGSLVRPPGSIEVLKAENYGQPYDQTAFATSLRTAVAEVVRQQAQAGVDVPSDGEFGKVGWTIYVLERFTGRDPTAGAGGQPAQHRELQGSAVGSARRGAIPAGGGARQRRGFASEPVLSERRSLSPRHRRRPARGVPRHHRRRPALTGRRRLPAVRVR